MDPSQSGEPGNPAASASFGPSPSSGIDQAPAASTPVHVASTVASPPRVTPPAAAPPLPPHVFPTRPGSSGQEGGRQTQPPARGSGKGWLWLLLVLVMLGGFGIAGLVVAYEVFGGRGGFSSLASGGSTAKTHLREVVLEPADTHDKIAVIEVSGVITGAPVDYEGTTLVNHIEDQLERAADDDHVKAVLLKVDSPGGEVLASDEIYKLLQDFQEQHGKPVVASMGTVAASGGYYISAPCRWIVCHDLTITGSIGVIMESYNWRGLMDKLGVHPQVFKSGPMKDMLSPDKSINEITAEERRIVQDLVNETFGRFKEVIVEGRGLANSRNKDNSGDEEDQGRKLAGNWEEFADGRLLSGKDALKLGLVDELGDFAAATDRARKLAGIEEAKLIQYLSPPSFGSLFRLLGKAPESRLKIDFGVPLPQIRAGLYFLAPNLVR